MGKNVKIHILLFIGTLMVCFVIKSVFFPAEKSEEPINKKNIKTLTNVKVTNTIINIGKIKTSTKSVGANFFIQNIGPNDLLLYDVKPDCKCTVGHIEKNKIIKMGDSIPVRLEFTPKVPGVFQVSAVVKANSEIMPMLVLRGEVLPN